MPLCTQVLVERFPTDRKVTRNDCFLLPSGNPLTQLCSLFNRERTLPAPVQAFPLRDSDSFTLALFDQRTFKML
jgi:hypothetical protein